MIADQNTAITNKKIEQLVKVRRENYLNDPLQIVADYNNEHKNIDEYNGRQLLEMIQNANDESDTNKRKKVLIRLDEDKLIIANNGNPFSEGGVESLMYSDLSPKTMEENKVGKKGLGFRSILNWSKEIYIASYDLHLKFSRSHAEEFLEGLTNDKNFNVQEVLKRKTKVEKPISVLRCPYIEENPSKKVPEYDTVIELTLKDNVQEEILHQISVDLVPEIMIFLNKLEEIEVKTETQHFAFYKHFNSDDNSVKIEKKDFLHASDSAKWLWNIIEDKGELEGATETKKYELKIAYNPNEKIERNKLFSFFRTEVDFPYPVIAHGSFELKSDRNQLSRDENKFNEQLLEKLADLMIKCALKWTETSAVNYEALKLVLPNPNHTTILNDEPWKFKELMMSRISNAKIFPTLDNRYVELADNIKFYATEIDDLIPARGYSLFPNLLKSTTDQRVTGYFYNEYGNRRYEDTEFTDKINHLIENGYLTDQKKVDWVYVLCNHIFTLYNSTKPILPALLLDAENKPIAFGDEAISPSEGGEYELPRHVNIASINRQQFKLLKQRFKESVTRNLVEKLKYYNVTEYAINAVMQKVVSSTHNQLENSEADKKLFIREMHEALYSIYLNIKPDSEGKKSFPANLPSPFLYTRNGNLEAANKLYFGHEYSEGKLNEALFVGVEADLFLGDSALNQFGVEPEKSSIEIYFKWLGVANRPRRDKKQIEAYRYHRNPYFRKVFNNLKFPYRYNDFTDTISDLTNFENSWTFKGQLLWYAHFDKIVENAQIEFLLTWFIQEPEINTSITTNLEPYDSEINFKSPPRNRSRKLNREDIKSYIHYYLQKTNFIPSDNGEKVKVNESLLASANLKPLIMPPNINYGAAIFTDNKIDRIQIDYLLKRLGVKDNLKDLTNDAIYDYLLLHHESYKNDPQNIQNFYVSIIEATKGRPISDSAKQKEYFNNGLIYANVEGENKFVHVQAATYVDNPNFSQDLLTKLKCAKLPMRSGNRRMLELFGVKPLDYIEFNVAKDVLSDDHLNGQFSDEFNKIKPYLFTYRVRKGLSDSQIDSELSALKKVKITTCYDIKVNYKLNGALEELKLNDYEYIQDHISKVFYVKISKSTRQYSILKADYRFKETIADILCGAIKVTENRKDFMLLIGENPSDWDNVLSREFDNYEELEKEIRQRFGETLTREQKFWDTAFSAAKINYEIGDLESVETIYNKLNPSISKDEWHEFYRAFNFNDLSCFENIAFLQFIFEMLKIDLIDFNRLDFKVINSIKNWENKVHVLHDLFEQHYASYLYNQNNREGYSKLKSNSGQVPEVEMTNSLFLDIGAKYKSAIQLQYAEIDYDTVLSTPIVNMDEIYVANFDLLKKRLEKVDNYDYVIFESQKWTPKFNERVLFNDIEALYREIIEKFRKSEEEKSKGITKSVEALASELEDKEELMKTIEKDVSASGFELTLHNMETVPPSVSNKKKTVGRSSFSNPKNMSNTDIGFIGEKYAYELLKKEFDEVNWVSEYALKAGFPEGRDGLGYDFECKKGGEMRFVEVKSSITANYAFQISSNEVKVGHEKQDVYDVLLITNLLNENKTFNYLKGIFKYKENERFLENSKFRVENDSYKIKFK